MTEPDSFVVLLVDDDHDVLGANSRFLRLNNIDVVVADSAKAALQQLSEVSVDVIVTDLRMPGCDGIEFVTLARESRPLIPIVFFSGFAQVPDVVAAMKLGAVEFLEKPIDPDKLLVVLNRLRTTHYGEATNPRKAFEGFEERYPLKMRVLAYEKYLIECSLLQHNGQIADVLESLQINRRTLNDKMSKLGIKRDALLLPISPDENLQS